MGKRGDQTVRLFEETAGIFVLQYNGQIYPSVYKSMEAHAIAKGLPSKPVYFCIIDGNDTTSLLKAYKRLLVVRSGYPILSMNLL
ncbi:MAG: hypothetical protein AOA65_1354 [Candidatus Bathyarchaeota archaeon BA1]|nr:MAG: hypothetical protein AOA65_1354 [Candidatus Bathyarchaeota archaeon BA1]